MQILLNCLHLFVKWVTRKKKPPYVILAAGLTLLTMSAGFTWQVAIKFRDYSITASNSKGSLLADLLIPSFGLLFCAVGIAWGLISAINEWKRNRKKRVIVIRGEGLRKVASSSIDSQIHKRLSGQIIHLNIDITQKLRDGYVIEPAATFRNNIQPLIHNLTHHFDSGISGDVEVVYGGLLPVPFLFFIGNVLDDKGPVTVCDWNRSANTWQIIADDIPDDGDGFRQDKLKSEISKDAVIAVSFSYHANLEAIKKSFPGLRTEHLYLEHVSFDNHWSAVKQQRLALQFIEFVKSLQQQGVRRIHLILAAPSSVCVTFGRYYDSRNLPELIVYQYENSEEDTYPWGLYALSHGSEEGGFTMRKDALSPLSLSLPD